MRHICYVTGTRADFGLMELTLQAIDADPELRVSLIATGMHLDAAYGGTIAELEASGLRIADKVPVPLEPATGATMARNIGRMLEAFVDIMERERPDLVLLLGDRGEMLAGALAAIHLNIPIAHVHGGERSGTVDEPVRHAISKLAHRHFAATEGARQRLIRMGEDPDRIHVTGAPGLDWLCRGELPPRDLLLTELGLNPDRPFALMLFHPVLQEADRARADTELLLEACDAAGVQVLALMPNADAGSDGVRAALAQAAGRGGLIVRTHLPRPLFAGAMAYADLMIGNSSAGIIEAATFGTPVLNVGRRQNLRERSSNVRDVPAEASALRTAILETLAAGRAPSENVYGDGRAAERIVALLKEIRRTDALMSKVNSY